MTEQERIEFLTLCEVHFTSGGVMGLPFSYAETRDSLYIADDADITTEQRAAIIASWNAAFDEWEGE